jgi:hypothetical protein
VIKQTEVKVTPEEAKPARSEKMESVGGLLVKATLIEILFGLAMSFFSGSLLIYLLPKLVENAKKPVFVSPMSLFGYGFAYIFLTPILIMLVMASIIGLPIAGIMLLIYLLSMIVAGWIVAAAVGERLAHKMKSKALSGKYLSFGLGLVVLKLVGFVPVFVIGMGVIFSLISNNVFRKKKNDEKIS